ncbi:MAG: MarC family protein [Pseudomonadota bacterium]|nr:MarC family protein [Pseudomonadota bacterium]
MLQSFDQVFVPVFVAMSPLTVLPVFLSMTEGYTLPETQSLARKGIVTAFTVAMTITLVGQWVFQLLGITVNDLRVAGGLILLSLAMYDLILSKERRKASDSEDAGVVPLGTPLIVGPGTMTACLVLADTHGRSLVIVALVLNLALTALLLHNAKRLQVFLRPAVTRAFGKVMALFLAAIAVSMMRVGITAYIRG